MSRFKSLFAVGHLILAAAIVAVPGEAAAERGSWVEVTVTNLTRNQIISPFVVASHTGRFGPLFVLGDLENPASPELAAVAEDAHLMPLMMLLTLNPEVHDVQDSAAGIPPGHSATAEVEIRGRFRHLSMAGMLVTTNDAFFALRGVRVPRAGSSTYLSPAYDAGSEANTELCAHIPGPPCGTPGVRVTDGAEGFVHIHAGIHGIADLIPYMHDWRNPVAEITIRRVSGRN